MNQKPAAITNIADAATARWLSQTLAPARQDLAQVPTMAAVDRIRLRVFGEPARRSRTLAA